MKQSNILQKIIRNNATQIFAAVNVFFMAYPVWAQAQGLGKVKDVLEKLSQELKTIIPIAAAVILLCLAIGYAGRYIEKDTFIRWGLGVIIAGSAAELANMLFTKG
ncbi:type IV secretory pathway VirB2 component (pilin) [Bartonella fuyuanensis]|uniref:Type IV secretory pathway VirB2 component (Pilin) n=1 Tax=Bartonella fuyuanensis TaxID=1460968 RepID=A0A840E3L5_9HYPH|nr:VirB2 family type IV secretion system major pilin TrwL [Bartonella fuyuanensis]MBB4075776.1 type IV secretory pathway VirB2 component (pilin) [Bartonella fuyuanensis]